MSSILDSGLKLPLKFYDGIKYQDRNKVWCKGKARNFDLMCPNNRLLPFQCVRLNSPFPLHALELVDASTGDLGGDIVNGNMFNVIPPEDFGMYIFEEVDYLVYYGARNLRISPDFGGGDYVIPNGRYYLRIRDKSFNYIWFSEVFTVANFTEQNNNCFLEFSYCSCSPLDDILYGTNYDTSGNGNDYKSKFFLDADLGEPKYKVEETGFEDQNKEFHPTMLKHTKTYRLELVLPEFMVDAISIIQLHEVVWIRLPNGRSAPIKDIKLIDVKWNDNSSEATCALEFSEQVIIKQGCCTTNVTEVDAISELMYKGYTVVYNSAEYWNGVVAIPDSTQISGFSEKILFKGDYVLVFDDDDRRVGRLTRVTYPDGARPQDHFDETNYITVLPANDTQGTAMYSYNDEITFLRIIEVSTPYWDDRPVMIERTLTGWSEYGGTFKVRAVIFPNTVGQFFMISTDGSEDVPLGVYLTADQTIIGYTGGLGNANGDVSLDPQFYIKTYCYYRNYGTSEPMP